MMREFEIQRESKKTGNEYEEDQGGNICLNMYICSVKAMRR